MRKSKTMRVASFLLVLTLMTSCFVGSTFAKYTSTASGSDTATVAKWSIFVNNNQIAAENPSITFDLFNTIKDSDGSNNENDVGQNLIAPGTSGSFDLKILNGSEVTAKYEINFEVTNTSNIPIQYSIDNGNTWSNTLSSITDKTLTIGAAEVTETVQWRWTFNNGEEGNKADTALGITAQGTAPFITVKATLTAEQVD